MIRPMASNVSALSGNVANGHQAIHFVSSAPSKIPYGGFSPVRLQTRFRQRPPSRASQRPLIGRHCRYLVSRRFIRSRTFVQASTAKQIRAHSRAPFEELATALVAPDPPCVVALWRLCVSFRGPYSTPAHRQTIAGREAENARRRGGPGGVRPRRRSRPRRVRRPIAARPNEE